MEIVALFLALLSSTNPLWSFTVAGTVVDEKGKPIAGARVEMIRLESGPEDAVHEAETDGEGRFRIAGLPLARFEMTAASPEHAPFVKRGIAAPPGASTLDVGGLKLRKRGLISGQVVDPRGRPVQGAEAWLMSMDPLHPTKAVASTGPDGRFELRRYVKRDDQSLYLCRPGYVLQYVPEEMTSQPLRIVLVPAVPVSGRVVDSEGQPVEGATFTVTFSGSSLSVLGPATTLCPSGEVKGTGAGGGFAMELEKPGWYQLRTTAPGHFSTSLERLRVPDEGLAGLEIRLRKGALVSGRVTNPQGAPIAGAEIRLSGGQENGEAVSDADGRYIVKGVEPGERDLSVRHPDHAEENRTVQIPAEGKTLDVVLHPRLWLEVRGHVVGPDGSPVAGARVENLERHAVTADDGLFLLKMDRSTEHRLQASKAGFGQGAVFLDPDQPLPDDVEIRLPRGVELTGRLLDVEPEDLSWARVFLRNLSYPEEKRALVDSDGGFRVFDLSPGPWQLHALAGGQSVTVDLEIPPDSPGVTQDVRFEPTYEVRGRVTGPEGNPVPGARVDLVLQLGRRDGRVTETLADENGFFSVRVDDGPYVATAIADGFERSDAEHQVMVDGGPVDGVEIRLRSGAALTGRFPGLEPGEAVPLLHVDGPQRRSYFAIPGEADQEGGYRLTNLGPGEWTVIAGMETRGSGGSVERIAQGKVTIPEGAAEARLDLDFHLGDLALTVRFANPDPGLRLELRHADGSAFLRGSSQDDRVHIPRLRAGSYRLAILRGDGTVLLDEPVDLTVNREIVVSPPAEQQNRERR